MARAIGTYSTYTDGSKTVTGEVNISNVFSFDLLFYFLLQMYSPPKYEEAIKSTYNDEENYSPPPYTPLLQGTS